ncbi:hypothetical protein [Vibrio campbellii]|uniref:hypothetical protein n=1 Tax=Vibrio campbellii TaxID=680 RepID=UPI00168CEF49|nr:hypothetical protein [Vibrio campbellii]
MNKVNEILLLIYGFFLIFRPDIGIGIIFIHIIFLITILLVVLEGKIKKVNDKKILFYVFSFSFLFFYNSIFTIFKTGDFSQPYVIFTVVVEVVFCLLYIAPKIANRSKSILDIYHYLLKIGLIQVFFVFLTIVFPDFRLFILSLSRNTELVEISNYGSVAIRSFGFAEAYTSTMPAFLSVCLAICLLLFLNEGLKRYIFFIPLLFIGIVLNARTPIVIIFFVLVAFSVLSCKFTRITKFYFLLSMTVALIFLSFFTLLGELSAPLKRLTEGFIEVGNLFSGKATGTFDVLLDMFVLPPTLMDNIFGTGVNVFLPNDYNFHSDSGYIRDIYMSGFLSIIIQFLAIFSIYYYNVKIYLFVGNSKKKYTLLMFLTALYFSYMIINFKGSVFYLNELTVTLLIITFFNYFYTKKQVS